MAHAFRLRRFDFVVVGSGPAGSATAAAITRRNPAASVALIEMGLGHQPPGFLKAPLARALLPFAPTAMKFMTMYETEPETGLLGRRLSFRRGTCFGGNSCFDTNWVLRGTTQEHARWGHPEWTFDKLLPFHMKAEAAVSVDDPKHHGTSGPIVVSLPSAVNANLTLNVQFSHACEVATLPAQPDVNSGDNGGCFWYQSRVDRGVREDVFRKLIVAELQARPNLVVHSEALVDQILLDESGLAVTGVRITAQGQQIHLESPNVICCGGAIGTPLLLQRSGIGPRELLAKFNIPVRVENEHVGSNLIEATTVDVVYDALIPHETRHKSMVPKNFRYLFNQWREWAEVQTGVWASSEEVGCFLQSREDVHSPDLHLTMRCMPALQRGGTFYIPRRGFTLSAQHCHPEARGHVRIGGAAAHAKPSIVGNHLTVDSDLDALRSGVVFVRRLVDAEKLLKHEYYEDVHGFSSPLQQHFPTEAYPGCVTSGTPKQLDEFLRKSARGTGEMFGTCAMGTVVDETLAVRGVKGLYVADSSIVPVPMAATATTMAIAIGTRCGEMLTPNV
jgi:choline dehydrogenase